MKPPRPPEPPAAPLATVFALLFGGLLGLALLKFGNPCILEQLVERPTNGIEWLINPWPITVGFTLLTGVALVGIFAAPKNFRAPLGLALLPAVWLAWQFLAAPHSVDAKLTLATLKHFSATVGCFYLGWLVLARVKNPLWFFVPLIIALAGVIISGWQQHSGGLEQTRKYFFAYIYPQMPQVAPEYLKKISSNRIFGTLFYPNALAGVLLLLLPGALTVIWQRSAMLTPAARGLAAGLLGTGALAALYWSQSKAGWLLMLGLGLVALLRLNFARRVKLILVGIVLLAGLAGFALRFAGYFAKGATSVSARSDYWRAAAQTAAANPVWGTGPGTFAIPYKAIKKPESEMARLTHNDFLQQASDSGLPGATAYLAFIAGSLWVTGRRVRQDALAFAVWLGLLAWSLQSALEFGLYIPALGWTAFALFGWLLGRTDAGDAPSGRA